MPSYKLFSSEYTKNEINKLVQDLTSVGADVENYPEDGYLVITVDDDDKLNHIKQSLLVTGFVKI